MKRRILAAVLALTLIMGMSMSVCARDYNEHDIKDWTLLRGGDTVTFEGIEGNALNYFSNQADATGTVRDVSHGPGTVTVRPGTWYVHHEKFPMHYSTEYDNRGILYKEAYFPLIPYSGLIFDSTDMDKRDSRIIRASKMALMNETLDFEAGDTFDSLPNDVFIELAKRSDLTYRFHFVKDTKNYLVTIPAGSDMTPICSTSGSVGLLYVGSLFQVEEE